MEAHAAPFRTDNLCLEIATQTRYCGFDQNGGYDVVQDQPNPNDGSGQILSFHLRRRIGLPAPRRSPITPDGDRAEPADDLAAFEEEDDTIDYRHRMLMNVIAVVIVSILISAGVWLADTIAAMQKIQDCALQGRQNCAPIEVPLTKK